MLKTMSVTLKLQFDRRKPLKKKGGEFPFKLRVTFQRRSLEFQTIYSLSVDDEKKLGAPRISAPLHDIRKSTNKCLSDAQNYVDNVGEGFSWNLFIRDFVNRHAGFLPRKLEVVPVNVSSEFDYGPYENRFKSIFMECDQAQDQISYVFCQYIRKLIRRRKIGSALNYQYAYNSLKNFRGNVRYRQITEDWLYEYEDWMTIVKENSLTTVAIVLRCLRCIFNEAASKTYKIINKEYCYPFGKRGYQIPTSRNTKMALSAGELATFYKFKSDDPVTSEGMDYWWLLYFGNGMNLKDAALLRFSYIQGNFIVFRRAKVERTSRTTTLPICVYINDDIKAIIDRRGNKVKDPDNFIFPILREDMNPLEQYDAIKAFIRRINDATKNACLSMGLDKKASTKVARHCYMTEQKRNGSSTEEIQEAVGHTNPSTTQYYLDSFALEVKMDLADRTTRFKDESKRSRREPPPRSVQHLEKPSFTLDAELLSEGVSPSDSSTQQTHKLQLQAKFAT